MQQETLWAGIEAIVLDAVGTLIEPWPPVAAVYAEAAHRQGIALDQDSVQTRFRRAFREDEGAKSTESHATDEVNEVRRWQKIVASVLPELPEPERAFEELWNHFGHPNSWRCFDDVGPVLGRLRANQMPIAIASNFDSRLNAIVAGLPVLAAARPTLLISSEIRYRKPHPFFYEAVSERLGIGPGSLLMVGDDLENDVLGACRSGLRGVLLDRRQAAREACSLRVTRLTELVGLV